MPDIAVTREDVGLDLTNDSTLLLIPGTMTSTVTQGQIVYREALGSYELARANSGTTDGSVTDSHLRVVMTPAVAGATAMLAIPGMIIIPGGTLVLHSAYALSEDVAGAWKLSSGLSSGDQLTVLGVALDTTRLLLVLNSTGEALA